MLKKNNLITMWDTCSNASTISSKSRGHADVRPLSKEEIQRKVQELEQKNSLPTCEYHYILPASRPSYTED